MARGKKTVAKSPAPASAPLDLEKVRGQIDSIDEKIQSLINDRARLAQLVGISKTREGKTVDFYRPEREAQVLRMARERNKGPLRDEEILRLFREIMSACLAQQEPLKVAYLGPEGTFSQAAVPYAACRLPRSTRSSMRSRPQVPISASCRSRTRRKGPSITPWIGFSARR